MENKEILVKIKEIWRLRKNKGEEFRKVKLRFLKGEILKNLGEKPKKIGSYIISKAYAKRDITKPYLQIFTKKTWKIHQDFLKGNKI